MRALLSDLIFSICLQCKDLPRPFFGEPSAIAQMLTYSPAQLRRMGATKESICTPQNL